MHWLEGLGWERWRVVVVPGGWAVGENPILKEREVPPQGPRASLTGLSNIESGGPQAANNNFVGRKL